MMENFLADPAGWTEAALFYAFSAVLLFSALMVISVRNPVHAVLFLILAFFNAAGLFLLMGAEFVAMLLVIVYVGAVAVLFLFVVMMLDIDFRKLRQSMKLYFPIGLVVGGIFAMELVLLVTGRSQMVSGKFPAPHDVSNTEALGRILYTDFLLPFQLAGLVLLVAMIGAIVLTHRENTGIRRQKIADQVERRPSDVVIIKKAGSGEGVET
jgi:NADH-quinone oxidoreductase subunit J